jgi:hypothetical protein
VWVGAGLAVLGLLPMLATLFAAMVASLAGCRLDEGDAHPCLILGVDWGDTLYALGVMFWLELATIWLVPIGLVVAIIGAVYAIRMRR